MSRSTITVSLLGAAATLMLRTGNREVEKMLKFAVRRRWSVPLLGLVIVLAGCKSGSGGGGY
jgi:hypothetical protein